jgi:hypothetical protein
MSRKQNKTVTLASQRGVRICLNHRDPVNWKKVAAQNPRWVYILCKNCNGHIAYESIDGGRSSRLMEAAQGDQPTEPLGVAAVAVNPKPAPKPAPRIKEQPSQEPATAGESHISKRHIQTSLFG